MNEVRRNIGAQFDKLAVSLVKWDGRDNSVPQPEVRQAGSDAIAAIDAMSRDLYQLREQLVGQMRETDDAADARIDALLAKRPQVGGAS